MLAVPVTALFDLSTFWQTLAATASAVALWAQAKAHPEDPVDELMDRLRHPIRWAIRHPVVSVKRRVDRRRLGRS